MGKRPSSAAQLSQLRKTVEELVLIIAGSAALDHKGLIQRQREDEVFQKDVLLILHDLKKDNKLIRAEIKTLRDEDIKTLRNDFEGFRGYFKLPTTKKFWVGIVVIVGILVILSQWTSIAYHFIMDAIVRYFNKNF